MAGERKSACSCHAYFRIEVTLMDYQGKTAFITGGASGIGLALAKAVASRGCKVLLADVQREAMAAASEELRRDGGECATFAMDVTDRAAVYACAKEVARTNGRLDFLFNNAGIGDAGSPLETISDSLFDWLISVNVTGAMNVLKAFIPVLKQSGQGGHIVNTSSMAGLVVMPGWNQGLYSASKMAVLALSLDLRDALASQDIGVSVLCPGLVSTNILENALKLRPDAVAGAALPDFPEMLKGEGMSAAEVADITLRGIEENLAIIVTEPELWPLVEAHHKRISDAFHPA